MSEYNSSGASFARSRENMIWPEIEYFFSTYEKHIYSSNRVLDVGCGGARLLDSLKKSNFSGQYFWIDNSLVLLHSARKKFPENNFSCDDMKELETLSGKYDSIFFIASFHHLGKEDQEKVLEKIFHFLSPGGYIFMTNWNLMGAKNIKKYENSRDEKNPKNFHIKLGKWKRFYYGFELQELEDLGKNTGYTVVENKIFSWERNIITVLKK